MNCALSHILYRHGNCTSNEVQKLLYYLVNMAKFLGNVRYLIQNLGLPFGEILFGQLLCINLDVTQLPGKYPRCTRKYSSIFLTALNCLGSRYWRSTAPRPSFYVRWYFKTVTATITHNELVKQTKRMWQISSVCVTQQKCAAVTNYLLNYESFISCVPNKHRGLRLLTYYHLVVSANL